MNEPLRQSDAIARELEELGEAPLSEDELAMLALDSLEDQPAVAGTARLIELSQPYASVDLSELDAQRVWRRVEQRRGSPRVASEGRRWGVWMGHIRPIRARTGAALALAAALALVVSLPSEPTSSTGPSATEVASVGEQARSALRVLDDGLGDTARAEQMSRDYQRRLEAKP